MKKVYISFIVLLAALICMTVSFAGCKNRHKESASNKSLESSQVIYNKAAKNSSKAENVASNNTSETKNVTDKKDTYSDIKAEVADVEKQYKAMGNRLENEDLTQSDMNLLAEDMYKLWDNEINNVWRYLKDRLDKATMDSLKSEEKKWVAKKEKDIKKAGSEYEGGSAQPMAEYLKGAELTRDRIYQLIKLLK